MKKLFARTMIMVALTTISTLLFAGNDLKKHILTPPTSPKPRINGAKIFGVRPGSPFFFKIPVTGKRPLKIMVKNLPAGLKLDGKTGIIKGQIKSKKKMTYNLQVYAMNKLGKAKRDFRIVVGDTICLTPPMGWNSWYACSEGVSAKQVKEVADAFVKFGLREHGWSYINIDDCWQGPRDPKTKALTGNERFPDMKGMCDYVHDLGLKIGIYTSPWIGTYAGFRGSSCDNPEGTYDNFLPADKRIQPNQVYGRSPGFITHFKAGRVGKYWFFDRDVKAMGEWGIDYLKVDWNPNDIPTATRMYNDLLNSGRDIVFSLSNAAPIRNASGLCKVSNLWRTGIDIHDNWRSISRGFKNGRWNKFQSPGHWNDMDMLQVGMRGAVNSFNAKPKKTKLTPDEQYTQISMWCLQSNPLLLSCYVHLLDEFTLSLLTNDEVIEINQDPLGNVALCSAKTGDLDVWSKKLEDGSVAVGLFNRGETAADITVKWSDLGLKGDKKVRDLWRQKDMGTFKDSFTAKVNRHGVVLIKIK